MCPPLLFGEKSNLLRLHFAETASLGYFTKDKNRPKNKQNGHNQEQADILKNGQFYMLVTWQKYS